MKRSKWKTYLWQILIAEAVGAASGLLSKAGMESYQLSANQPSLAPPPALFPIAWGILYALMGISAARVILEASSPQRSRSINLYIAQLIVNFFWSPIFFNAQQYGGALLWLIALWILVLLMIISMYRTKPIAGLVQIPYLLWLTFAAILNYAVWQLNK